MGGVGGWVGAGREEGGGVEGWPGGKFDKGDLKQRDGSRMLCGLFFVVRDAERQQR